MIKITDGKNILVIPTTAFENYKNSGWQVVARKTKDSIIKKDIDENQTKENNNNYKNKNRKRK